MSGKPNYPADLVTSKSRPPGVLSANFYYWEYGNFCHRPRGTLDWLIMYTVAGRGIVESATRDYECQQGDIVLIAPETRQEFYTAENHIWVRMWCHFTPRPSLFNWVSFTKCMNGVLYLSIDSPYIREHVHKAFERLLFHHQSERSMSEELAMNALEEIVLLIAEYQRDQEQEKLDPRVQEVIHFLMHHYASQIKLADLAQQVCLSPSRLTHLFKEQVGHSITDVLQTYRLKQAARLLRTTDDSILHISTAVGFNSSTFFTKKFTSFYGTSPGIYRRQNKFDVKKILEDR